MNKELTVVITTFNRKVRLSVQLESLFRQPLYKQLEIVICDNCSDYDVEEFLKHTFSLDELLSVRVIKRPFNIGMIGNISSSFLFAQTKWMWLLSDDDETSIDSISTILKSLELYPDVMAFKFTEISESTKKHYKTFDVNGIPEMLDFCNSNKVDLGNFIFMSNNVYNMQKIKPYLGSAFVHSYTYFPHMLPILVGVNNGENLKFISESIVYYKVPEKNATSDYLVSIYLGAMTIADFPFDLNSKDYQYLLNFFKMNVFWEISNEFYNSTYIHKRYLYRKIYKSLFSYKMSIKNMLIYRIFDLQIYFGSNKFSNYCFSLKESLRKIIR